MNSWIEDNPKIDIITRLDMIDGVSHDVIVVFMEDDPKKFEYNACLTERLPESGICHKKALTGSDFQHGPINY